MIISLILILGLTSSLSIGLAVFIFDFNSVLKKLTSRIFSGVALLFDNQLLHQFHPLECVFLPRMS